MVVEFDPVIFSLGPLAVRWYGMMYVIGFVLAGIIMKQLVRDGIFRVSLEKTDTLVTYMLIGLFFGARLIYVFVYNWSYYASHWDEILAVWKGGLSYHGGVIGLIVGGYLFAKHNNLPFLQVADVAAISGSQGVFWGRMGNFINGELYGRVTDVPWAMVFPSGGSAPRHPSQLYEGILEGVVTFCLMWFLRKRVKTYGQLSGIYLCCYGVFRLIVEFFREPDEQLGYYFGFITMGQILCFLMICVGILFLFSSRFFKTPIVLLPSSKSKGSSL
jgi:phosphatidylglycerol---prolipoprotein diacylglyceryl transferase